MYLGTEGVGNYYTVASTDVEVDMSSTLTVEAIWTSLVARKREGIFCIQTLEL